jgi:hypothetical protein
MGRVERAGEGCAGDAAVVQLYGRSCWCCAYSECQPALILLALGIRGSWILDFQTEGANAMNSIGRRFHIIIYRGLLTKQQDVAVRKGR